MDEAAVEIPKDWRRGGKVDERSAEDCWVSPVHQQAEWQFSWHFKK